MLCPRCGGPLRESKKSSDYLLCDHCMKKIKIENAIPEDYKEKKSHTGIIVVGILLAILVIVLVAVLLLYGQRKAGSSNDSGSEESVEGTSELDALGDIEVDQNLFDVTVTVPSEYTEGITQEQLDETAEADGYKAVLNDDGSITYTMTKAQHAEMMNGLAESINEAMATLVGSEEYPDITSVSSNDDFTEFTITTTNSEISLSEGFSVLALYTYSGLYHIFDGTPVDNIHIDYVNADSGEIIGSSDSLDLENVE